LHGSCRQPSRVSRVCNRTSSGKLPSMIRRSTAPSLKGMSDDHDRLLQYRQQTHGPSFPCPPATRRRYRGSERDLGNTDASEVITGEFRRGQGMPWLSNGAEGSKALDRTHCCSRSNNSNEPFSGFLRERLFERSSCLSSAWPASISVANTSTSSWPVHPIRPQLRTSRMVPNRSR
jgi:hypothetical protein